MADTLELIKALPTELRERILKEYIKIKLREREYMGWDEVNEAILNAPYCLENSRSRGSCTVTNATSNAGGIPLQPLLQNGVRDYLGPNIFNPEEYDPCFQKSVTSIAVG